MRWNYMAESLAHGQTMSFNLLIRNQISASYELFIGDDNHQGGFIHVRGFGIDFRNRGGIYINGTERSKA
jgi:hypothetical protein